MAKMTKREFLRRRRHVLKYRYEFARRNKGYAVDYNVLKKICESNSPARFAAARDFQKKWAAMLADPHFSFEETTKMLQPGKFRKKFFFEKLMGHLRLPIEIESPAIFYHQLEWNPRPYHVVRFASGYKPKKYNVVIAHINLEKSKPEIFESLDNLLSRILKKANENKFHFSRYDTLLKVYDMKEKKGMSLSQIARKEYRFEAGGDNYAILKAKRDYLEAKRLVDGGYRQIR